MSTMSSAAKRLLDELAFDIRYWNGRTALPDQVVQAFYQDDELRRVIEERRASLYTGNGCTGFGRSMVVQMETCYDTKPIRRSEDDFPAIRKRDHHPTSANYGAEAVFQGRRSSVKGRPACARTSDEATQDVPIAEVRDREGFYQIDVDVEARESGDSTSEQRDPRVTVATTTTTSNDDAPIADLRGREFLLSDTTRRKPISGIEDQITVDVDAREFGNPTSEQCDPRPTAAITTSTRPKPHVAKRSSQKSAACMKAIICATFAAKASLAAPHEASDLQQYYGVEHSSLQWPRCPVEAVPALCQIDNPLACYAPCQEACTSYGCRKDSDFDFGCLPEPNDYALCHCACGGRSTPVPPHQRCPVEVIPASCHVDNPIMCYTPCQEACTGLGCHTDTHFDLACLPEPNGDAFCHCACGGRSAGVADNN